MNNLDCPVDHITVNENKVRITAFFVLILAIITLITSNCLLIAFLLIDFTLRAFNLNAYSPLGLLSGAVVKQFGLKNKPVDRAPKRFAAFVGVIFLAGILITRFVSLTLESNILIVILIVFASLESFMGFCAGCYVYTILKRFKLIG
jgi:hypothetical protein